MPDVTIDTLRIEIEAKSNKAQGSVSALASSLSKLKTAVSGNVGARLQNIADGIGSLSAQIRTINNAQITKIERLANSLNKIKNAGGFRAIQSATSRVVKPPKTQVQATVGATAGTEYDKITESTKKATQSVDDFLSRLSSADVVKMKISNLKAELDGLLQDSPNSSRIPALTMQIKNLEKQLDTTGKTAGKTATGGFGKLLGNFKRIATYRLFRLVLQQIVQALKDGVKAVYEFSKATGGAFAQQVDSLSSAFESYKVSLGAALAPLLSSLMPTLEMVLQGLTKVNEGLGKVFAFLGDGTYYTVNTKAVEEYTKSLKNLKSATLGFDELNILSPESQASNLLDSNNLKFSLGLDTGAMAAELVAVVAVIKGYGGLSKWVKLLTDSFIGKNETLGEQTKKTLAEKVAVYALGGAFAFGLSNALGWNKGLETNSQGLQVVTDKVEELEKTVKAFDTSVVTDKIAELEKQFADISKSPAFANLQGQVTALESEIAVLTDKLENNSIDIATDLSGIQTILDEITATQTELGLQFDNLAETEAFKNLQTQLTHLQSQIDNITKGIKGVGTETETVTKKSVSALEVIGNTFKILGSILLNSFLAPFKLIWGIVQGIGWVFKKIGGLFSGAGTGAGAGAGAGAGGGYYGGGYYGGGYYGGGGVNNPNFFNDPLYNVTLHANGGYPSTGGFFIAGESGAELVGTINGRTGVASNQEITGIAEAVYSSSNAERTLLQEQNDLLRRLLAKSGTSISNKDLFKQVQKGKSEFGAVLTTGGVL